MSDTPMQATPHADLIAAIMDSRVPKTEREHAAAKEIERLREELSNCTTVRRCLYEGLSSANQVVAARNDEIERLRADRDAFNFIASTTVSERDAEIERLSQETLVQSECIETLRGLLGETFTMWLNDADPAELPDLVRSAREALGDKP